MLACYMVLIQNWPPHLALAPIAQVDPPLMPFRDAGYSQADYGISVQDVVYGVWRAKEEKCCDLENFDLDMYERFERVENGDFNWLTPHLLAFASPQHSDPETPALPAALPRDVAAVQAHATLPQPFKNVLCHFADANVGLVVRLNSPLYSPSYFEALGINHLDMIFDDGTCPPLSTVRRFIHLAHETITTRRKAIAVHCKAGLGRTGCLIGAYLIYRHGFTANEVIAFMRFMRPGMVVGPQQHWLHLNQGTFREWWVEERVERRLRRDMASPVPSTPVRAMHKASLRNGPASTPLARTPLAEVDGDRRNVAAQDDCLPAPTPGQPRKAARADRHHPYQRAASLQAPPGDAPAAEHPAEAAATHRQRSHGAGSDDEAPLRVRGRRGPSQSPGRGDGTRSVSHATATLCLVDDDASRDAENIGSLRAKHHRPPGTCPERVTNTPGAMARVRAARRESPLRAKDHGVRKTSGRVGGAVATARKASGS